MGGGHCLCHFFCLQTVLTQVWPDFAATECKFSPYIGASARQNLSLGFSTKQYSNQYPQLQRPRSAVGNVYGYRCVSDCISRGREFDPGPVLNFRGDWSWNYFYGHSPPFRWFIQEGLLSVKSESMCTNYWLTACEKVWLGELAVPPWP